MPRQRPASARPSTRLRCSACGGALRPTHRFCPNCGAPAAGAATAPPQGTTPPTAAKRPFGGGVSLQVGREQSLDLSENRRLVTVMFCDLSGSTALGERLDPEDLRRILAQFFGALAREIQRYGGTVDKYIGDAVMAVFGAPVAHEDDAERTIRAAIAMQSAIGQLNEDLERRHGARLALRIGINTGEVVAGLLAGDVQAAYTVVGDSVNTAQRFESAAPLGGILVSEPTWRLARRRFRFQPVEPLVLKGKTAPQPAYRVLGVREQEIELAATPLIGRAVELGRLRAALESVFGGRGALLHVVGEAGVGKSRLIREFRGDVDTLVTQFVSRCASFETDTPYAVVARLLRFVFGVPRGTEESLAREGIARGFSAIGEEADPMDTALLLDVLGYREHSGFDPQSKQRVLVNLLRRIVRLRTERSPLIVLFEDLHWADSASIAVVGELARDIPARACLVLTTSRPGWMPPWPAESIVLEPLPEHGARSLVEAAFGTAVETELADTILARTGGNPFFIEEVVRGLWESDVLVERDGKIGAEVGATPRVPTTVQEVLTARLDRLPLSAKRVLQVAAVCGRLFQQRVLEELVFDTSVSESIATLQRERFILPQSMVPEPIYVFRHALIQEVAYQTQLQSQRRSTHAAIGEAIEGLYAERIDELVDTLALHYGRSDNDQKAKHYLLRAGRRAQRLYANAEAMAAYRAALERCGDDQTARVTALDGIGDLQRLAGQYAEALASYSDALEAVVPNERIVRANLLRKRGSVHQLMGNSDAGLESFELALANLPAQADRERAFVLIELGDARWRQGRFDEAIESLSRAIAHAERAGANDARADALRHLGTIHVLRGDAPSGLSFYQQSLALYEMLDDLLGQANVHNNIGVVHRREGHYPEALDANAKALKLRERIGDPWGIAMTRNNLAEIHRTRGDVEQAIEDYQAALTQWGSVGHLNGVAIARTGLGIARVEIGQTSLGRADLRTALGEWAQLGSRTYLSETQRYLARAYLPDQHEVALRWAEQAVETARDLRALDQEGIALQVLGLVREARGEVAQALTALERSRDILRATTERQELARTLAALGRVYQTLPADDERSARADLLLDEARAIFTELGAALDLRRLEAPAGAH